MPNSDRRRQDGPAKRSYYYSPLRTPKLKLDLLAKLAARKESPRPGRRQTVPLCAPKSAITLDHGLAAAGTFVAVFSFLFAAVMVFQNDGRPGIERDEVLRLPPKRSSASLDLAQERLRGFSRQAIDVDVTGSIIPFPPGRKLRRPKAVDSVNQTQFTKRQPSRGYALSFVYKNMALVKGGHGFYAAKVGTALPDAGKVLSIERRGKNWVLVAQQAVITEAN